MPNNTYVAIDKKTIVSPAASITFSAIPQSYTDLVVVTNSKVVSGGAVNNFIRFNGDTNTNYSATIAYATGSAASSYRSTNNSGIIFDDVTSTEFNAAWIHISGYSNSTTYKPTLTRASAVTSTVQMSAGVWRSTAPITSITIYNPSTNLAIGSTFTLYGIKAWSAEVSLKATGGYVYEDSSYWYHSFPFSSTFTPSESITADILVVAGGGAGGPTNGAGGGGAGGLVYLSSQSLSATNYTVTVGAGGALTASSKVSGNNSQFASTTAAIGGGGGGYDIVSGDDNGLTGGSGGGGAIDSTARASGTAGQGNQGGLGKRGSNTILSGGGGGGATTSGADAGSSLNTPGAGGDGSSSYSSWGIATQTGENVNGTFWYAGGGAGNGWTIIGTAAGGLGGGGSYLRSNGVVSSGGGGFAGYGSGGSGVVIVRYAK